MTMFTEHSFPRHSHDQFGLGVMTSGAQRSWSVLGQVEACAGDVIMVNPGEMHDGAPVGGARGWHIIYLDPALVAHELAPEPEVGELVVRPVARDLRMAGEVKRLLEIIETPSADPLLAEESLMRCLLRMVEKHAVDPPPIKVGSPSVALARERLEDEPQGAVSLAELAAISDVSRFQLLRGFSREVGATPHAYRTQLRVRLARRYLAAGLVPSEAAQMAGFADQSHMTRAFVRQFGITPGRYRAAIT
jgi:AraC-like DNA-binding protein